MTLPEVPVHTVAGYLLVMLRVTAWLVIAPPFSHKAIPAQAKALFGFALTLAVGASMDFTTVSLDTSDIIISALWQVTTGVGLGFVCYLAFAAVEAAGNLVDLFGGFQLTQAFDPQMQSGAAVNGRLYQMTALVLLFVSDGYLVLLHGLSSTFSVIGLDEGLSWKALASAATDGTTQVFISALQIAGPLIAILFLTDVGLGLLTRAAPALQAFSLGFPLKIFITLAVSSMAVAALPSVVEAFSDDANHAVVQIANASDTDTGAAASSTTSPDTGATAGPSTSPDTGSAGSTGSSGTTP